MSKIGIYEVIVMDYKKLILISIIVCFLTLSAVSASWHGLTSYSDGECGLFSVSCPSGYKNGGEIQHDNDVFISTSPGKFPYHSIVIEEIDDEDIDNLYDDYDIVDSVDHGDFKAYKLEESTLHNGTVAIYTDGDYKYILEMEHKGCPYDDSQFEDDVDTLEHIANSLYRK